MRRWVSSGDHVLREWTPQLPCTTPASQLGILHGTIDRVPAFRWYDRELGRLLVANRPADAAIIEERASDGRGLLADGGVSVSNIFTGDAPRAFLTMSRAKLGRSNVEKRRTFAGFLTDPQGFMRAFVRTIAEIVKERFQARRQVRRDLMPRVHRGWTFAVLRAATNVLGRDLNTAIITEEMRKGTRSIYVDYVDYDEIAHHAGIFRPESLAALDGLDRVLGTLERLAESGARRYHFVIVSDHGQSQGQVFADRYGIDLATLCGTLMEEQVESVDAPVEGWGRAEAVADGMGTSGVTGRFAGRASDVTQRHPTTRRPQPRPTSACWALATSGCSTSTSRPGSPSTTSPSGGRPWCPASPPTRASASWPASTQPAARGRSAREGRIALDTGEVQGSDPLAPYGESAARLLCRAVLLAEAPDLYMNSTVDADTLDIAAFEPLVGAHGGLGGWQDRAVLLVPKELAGVLPQERIEGADHLHRVLVGMLESLGHRTGLKDPV